MDMEYVIKLSGHVFDNPELIKRYVNVINDVLSRNEKLRFIIVTGGGKNARYYVNIVRELSNNESLADLVGIQVSRINAFTLLTGLLNYAYSKIPENINEVLHAWYSGYRVIICGGFQPGQSTATVALLVAECTGIKNVIDFANIDAVYTSDPRKDPNAKKLEKVRIKELIEILSKTSESKAGTYELIDLWALKIAERSKIRIYICNCQIPEKLPEIIFENKGYGTIILPD